MFILRKLESLTPQLPPRLLNVRNGPSLTMEVRPFEEINEVMDNSPIQHYISSVNAGEVVLLDETFLLPGDLRSKVAKIIRKQDLLLGLLLTFMSSRGQMALKFLAFPFLGREATLDFQPRRLSRPNTWLWLRKADLKPWLI
jgi:hypothetical protein